VPVILDLTVAFTPDSAQPTLLNVVLGKKCEAEMFVRYVIMALESRLLYHLNDLHTCQMCGLLLCFLFMFNSVFIDKIPFIGYA
jgi:hypothetical protein